MDNFESNANSKHDLFDFYESMSRERSIGEMSCKRSLLLHNEVEIITSWTLFDSYIATLEDVGCT